MDKRLIKSFTFLCGILLVCALSLFSQPVTAASYINEFHNMSYTNSYGSVKFQDTIHTNRSAAQLEYGIRVIQNEIEIDTVSFPELNVKAEIEFYGTGITEDALIYQDEGYAPLEPTLIEETLEDWETNVSHFSRYVIVQSEWNGTHNGTVETVDGNLGKAADANFIFYADTNLTEPGGTQVKEQSASHLMGALQNDCHWESDVGLNQTGAYSFNGIDQSISFAAAADFWNRMEESEGFTFTAWINSSYGPASTRTILGGKGGLRTRNLLIYLDAANQLKIYMTNGTDFHTYNPGIVVSQDDWHFIGFTYDKSTTEIRLIYDNTVHTSITNFVPIFIPESSLNIGALQNPTGSNTGRFSGVIDYVQVWPKILLPLEVESIRDSEPRTKYVFVQNGTYTTITYNISDYHSGYGQQEWESITLDSPTANITILGRSAFCENLNTASYIIGVQDITTYNFEGLIKPCFDSDFVLGGTVEESPSVGDYNLTYTFQDTNYTPTGVSCGPEAPISEPCDVVASVSSTPVCSTYNLYNSSAEIISDGLLYNIEDDVWVFNFNQTEEGPYLAEFCDGSSKDIYSKEDEQMYIAMILGIALFVLSMLYITFKLEKEHFVLKLLTLFFAVITLMVIAPLFVNGVLATAATFIKLPLAFFTLFIIYFTIYLFYHWTKEDKWGIKKWGRKIRFR